MQSDTHTYSISRTYDTDVEPEKVIQDLLSDRGIEDIDTFLQPPHPIDTPFRNFFDDKKAYDTAWKKTRDLLKKIHDNEKTIVVYTDYDADGVTGGAVMWEALHKLGFKVMPYVPARSEGYGFSREGIDRIIQEYDPALIISVDHGIVAHDEIKYAASKDVPVIVTDHHHKQDGDPKAAHAVFHTSDLSGSGVAYYFAKELIKDMDDVQNADHLKHMVKSDYVGLAAIGTIADLVPLTGPSRAVARYGLAALGTTSRVGLRNLMRESRISAPVTSYHVGFMIAPRINAFGRLEHAMDALRLLCTTSFEKADALSKQAQTVNTERQKRVSEAVREAESQVDTSQNIIILDSDEWEEGIIGLIASRMLQRYYKPAIVMTRSNGHAKASVRSVDDVHITDFLKDLDDYLIDMGGHAAAAGFSIKTEKIDEFVEAAYSKASEDITPEMLVRKKHIDVAMPYTMATLELAEALEELGPFGIGFKKPVFKSRIAVMNTRTMGKSAQHIKIEGGDGVHKLELVCFNAPQHVHNLDYGDTIDVMYTVDINEWNGRRTVQGIVKEIAKVA